MSFIYLFLLFLGLSLVISALAGVLMFIIDIKRYSSYKTELDNIKQKYSDKLEELENLQKEEEE